jgi:hypothetical protein
MFILKVCYEFYPDYGLKHESYETKKSTPKHRLLNIIKSYKTYLSNFE